ncbi:MAG: YgaP family membrane protein [Dictyoglomaceae bacterium]
MNVGKTDAIIRVIVGIILPHFTEWGILSGTVWIVILHIIGVILVFTAVIRYCPLYKLLNISTAK